MNDILDLGRSLQTPSQPGPQPAPQPVPQRAQPAAPAPQAAGLSQTEVRQLQQALAELGYDPGPADGVAGRRTVAAVAAFQHDRGLPATGRLDQDTYYAVATAWRQEAGSYRAETGIVLTEEPASPVTAGNAIARPSFDCTLAGTSTEYAICGSPSLAGLDRQIAEAYAAQMQAGDAGAQSQLRAYQKRWIARRDECAGDVNCLRRQMSVRLDQLGGPVEPGAPAVAAGGRPGAGGAGQPPAPGPPRQPPAAWSCRPRPTGGSSWPTATGARSSRRST